MSRLVQEGRIAAAFARIRTAKAPGLVTYVTAGDPDLARTEGILRALDRGGADVLEVGVPFSDPLADGPVIQRATERALAAGTTLAGVLDCSRRVRKDLAAPVVIFSYANPILRLGAERFADRAPRRPALTACWCSTCRIEEAGDFRNLLAARGIDTILLLSPTTSDERLRKAAAPRQRFSLCDFAPGRDRRARPDRRRSGGDGAAHPRAPAICRWRSDSASRSRSTCAKSASGPMRRWSAARWSTSLPRPARQTISTPGWRSMCVG